MPEPTRRQLVTRRRARQVKIAKAEKTLARLRADLIRLDAAIEANGGAVRAYTPAQHPAPRGAVVKAVLTALRQAGRPTRAAEIVDAMAGLPWAAPVPRRVLAERVRVALLRQEANGVLRREKGPGRRVMWAICANG